MAKAGDSYKVKLRLAHLGWGTYRKTNTRVKRKGEAYIQIPIKYARKFNILNSNGTNGEETYFTVLLLMACLKGNSGRREQLRLIQYLQNSFLSTKILKQLVNGTNNLVHMRATS